MTYTADYAQLHILGLGLITSYEHYQKSYYSSLSNLCPSEVVKAARAIYAEDLRKFKALASTTGENGFLISTKDESIYAIAIDPKSKNVTITKSINLSGGLDEMAIFPKLLALHEQEANLDDIPF